MDVRLRERVDEVLQLRIDRPGNESGTRAKGDHGRDNRRLDRSQRRGG